MSFRYLMVLLIGAAACRCSARVADAEWTPVRSPDLGTVVARVGQIPIQAKQVQAEATRIGKSPREALGNLVALHLLAERARRAGRTPARSEDPEVKSAMVQRLLERELEPTQRPEAVPDRVLRSLYDRAKDSFVHPRLVEVAILAVYTGAPMRGTPLEERTRTANELAAFLRNHPAKTLDDFAAVAHDPAWSSRHVVFDRFLQSPNRPLSRKAGEEIAKLRTVGETTGLLADDDGFYIARYVDERPPQTITFEQTRSRLQAGYLEHWQQQQFQEFTDNLIRAHKVAAHFDRLPQNEQGP